MSQPDTDEAAAELRSYAERLCADHITDGPLYSHGADILTVLAERDTLKARIAAITEGEWDVVTADTYLRLNPGSKMRLNSTETWIVGPKFKTKLAAARFLAALSGEQT